MNYKFTIAYNGSNYHGFQIQPQADKPTIQGELLRAFKIVTGNEVIINGCSRTDAGVHANEYVFSTVINVAIPHERLQLALNNALPSDIAVLNIEAMPSDFHARFDCKGKQYIYRITSKQNVFEARLMYFYPHLIDTELLNNTVQVLIGTHNFKSFSKFDKSRPNLNTVRTIYDIVITVNNNITEFKITGDGFLYNMVRIIVGTLLDINRKRLNIVDLQNALEITEHNNKTVGTTLPAEGLYLNKVYYNISEII